MTWAVVFLGWVVAAVFLGMLIGILLGIRRELEDVGQELNLTLHRVEEIQVELGEIRLQIQAVRTSLMGYLGQDLGTAMKGETEHIGTVAMETTPGKPVAHPWKRGRIGQDD